MRGPEPYKDILVISGVAPGLSQKCLSHTTEQVEMQ